MHFTLQEVAEMENDQAVDKQKVCIFTHQFKIVGYLSIYRGVRMTDYMNESNSFISITDIEVSDHHGNVIVRSKFLNVRKDDIEIILPEDSVFV